MTAYSERFFTIIHCIHAVLIPISAQKTKMMLTIMNISIAVSPSALGAKINANITDKDLWDVAGDAVEDVDEDEEDGD